eukprot:428642_1
MSAQQILSENDIQTRLDNVDNSRKVAWDAKIESCLLPNETDALEHSDIERILFDFIFNRISNDIEMLSVPAWYIKYYLQQYCDPEAIEQWNINAGIINNNNNNNNQNNNQHIIPRNNNNTDDRSFLFSFFGNVDSTENIELEFIEFFENETFPVRDSVRCCMCNILGVINYFYKEFPICQDCLFGILSRMVEGKGFDKNEIKLLNILYIEYEIPISRSNIDSYLMQKLGYFLEQYITKRILYNNFFSLYATNPPLFVMKRGSDMELVCFKKGAFVNAMNTITWRALEFYTWRILNKPMLTDVKKDLCIDTGTNIIKCKHNSAERLIYRPYGDAGAPEIPGVINLYAPSKYSEAYDKNKEAKQLGVLVENIDICEDANCICHEYVIDENQLWDENQDDEKEIYDKEMAIFQQLPPYLWIKNSLCDKSQKLIQSFVGKISHLLAKPEEKPGTCDVVTSVQGTGKDTMFEFISILIGKHNSVKCATIGVAKEKFNEKFLQKTLVLFDEVDRKEASREYSFLKGFITDMEQRQEIKFGGVTFVKVFQRLLLFSNDDQCVAVKVSDRRIRMYRCKNTYKNDREFFGKYREVLKCPFLMNVCYSALRKYIFYNPYQPWDIPQTRSRAMNQYLSLTGLQSFALDLITHSDQYDMYRDSTNQTIFHFQIKDLMAQYKCYNQNKGYEKINLKQIEVFLSNVNITRSSKSSRGKNAPAYAMLNGDSRGRINNVYTFSIGHLKTQLNSYFGIETETFAQFSQSNDNDD